MDKDQRRQIVADMTVTIVTTLVILLIWWVAELPEWKREALFRALMVRVRPANQEGLGPLDRMDLAAFRVAVSKYSHGGEGAA